VVLVRLWRRRLIPGLNPAPAVPGGAELSQPPCELDSLCPSMPLDVFQVYDVADVAQVSYTGEFGKHGMALVNQA